MTHYNVSRSYFLCTGIKRPRRTPWLGSSNIKDKRGEFRFHLKAGNGEIIASSEGYQTKAGALNGIESVKNAAGASVADLTE